MNITPFRAIYPNLDLIAEPDAFFASVKADFPIYTADGFFLEDDELGFYVYDIVTPNRTHSGIVACTDVNDYFDGRVMRHEHTLVSREVRMKELFLQRNALIKPVLMSYRRDSKLDKIMDKARARAPFMEITLDGGHEHVFYKISDPSVIKRIAKRFRKKVSKGYIADGHHRCVTSARLYEQFQDKAPDKDFSRILCLLMPFEDLVIHDYNRVVEILHEFSPTLFMARMSKLCHITPLLQPSKPREKYELTMYLLKEWYRLTWKKSVLKRYQKEGIILDGAILNREVLGDILGITDVREDQRLKYVQGMSGITGLMRQAEKSIFRVAFCLYPVQMEEIVQVTEGHKTLPPKSTWFEPRIKNGVLSVSFDRD